MIEVTDQAHLEALPDGSIISWLRIPGDETSRAIAFVRAELRPMPHDAEHDERVVWISPGGYSPQTPESAGVTYPAQVIIFGHFRPEDYPSGTEIPVPQLSPPGLLCSTDRAETEFLSRALVSGGTWAREAALAAAAHLWSGQTIRAHADTVIATAEKFEKWLERPAPSKIGDAIMDAASDDWGDAGPPDRSVD